MKDQVVVGPSGDIAVAIPLYRRLEEIELEKLKGSAIVLTEDKPIAYVLDMGDGLRCPMLDAEYVEKRLIFLGDL